MPLRNALFLVVVVSGCLAVWVIRDRELPGRRFNEVLTLIESTHVDPVDAATLLDAAVDGAVSKLDEHSSYVRAADRAALETRLDQRFAGVGLELAQDDAGELIVAAPVVGGPGWAAGITAGDRILAINGERACAVPLAHLVARLRGAPGEPVTLRVASGAFLGHARAVGSDLPAALDPAMAERPQPIRDVTLIRDVVRMESVLGDRRRPDGSWEWFLEGAERIACVRITAFGEQTVVDLDGALATIGAGEPPAGLVLDLRGNPGGSLTAAVDTCDRFLDEGTIVMTRRRQDGRGAPQDVRRATAGSWLPGVPLVVLIDGLTASSAEAVAACLQDQGRATVVGSRSYGKGTVQSVVPLSSGDGLLKLTTAEYLRPSGGRIHRAEAAGDDAEWGVRPDAGFEVTPTGAALETLRAWRRQRDVPPAPGGLVTATADVSTPAPCDVDEVLAVAVERLRSLHRDASAATTDLGGEKETARHTDEPVAPGQ